MAGKGKPNQKWTGPNAVAVAGRGSPESAERLPGHTPATEQEPANCLTMLNCKKSKPTTVQWVLQPKNNNLCPPKRDVRYTSGRSHGLLYVSLFLCKSRLECVTAPTVLMRGCVLNFKHEGGNMGAFPTSTHRLVWSLLWPSRCRPGSSAARPPRRPALPKRRTAPPLGSVAGCEKVGPKCGLFLSQNCVS